MSTEQETSEVKENGRKSKNLIIITGPTASGKDTVIDLFIERHPNFKRIVPYTTRTPHINEQDGVDYHFVSLEWFKQNQDRFCAITQRMISNQTIYYGTALSDLQMILKGEQRIWKLDPYTACNLDSCLGESLSSDEIKTLLSQTAIIYLGVDRLTVLKDRMSHRARPDDTRADFLRRLRNEWQAWLAIKGKVDPFICDLKTVSPEEFLYGLEKRLI